MCTKTVRSSSFHHLCRDAGSDGKKKGHFLCDGQGTAVTLELMHTSEPQFTPKGTLSHRMPSLRKSLSLVFSVILC